MAVDDQVVLAAELTAHVAEGLAHLACNFTAAEIGRRFIAKNRFVGVKMRMDGSFNGCHRKTSDRKFNFTQRLQMSADQVVGGM
jgi:hypothetical protein